MPFFAPYVSLEHFPRYCFSRSCYFFMYQTYCCQHVQHRMRTVIQYTVYTHLFYCLLLRTLSLIPFQTSIRCFWVYKKNDIRNDFVEHIKKSLETVIPHNWRPCFNDHARTKSPTTISELEPDGREIKWRCQAAVLVPVQRISVAAWVLDFHWGIRATLYLSVPTLIAM